jgi:predicted DNA-binding transcriptional regulator YafY
MHDLMAYCRQRQEHRTFRISRLKNVEVTMEVFELKKPSSLEMKNNLQPFVQLKLRFQAQVLNRLYDYFNDSFIVKNDDGSFTIDVAFPEGEWVYSYILSFGNFVEVLEPEHVRKTIVDRMREALNIYEQ